MPKKKSDDPLLDELVMIKKLLMLVLIKMDVPNREINKAVNMGEGNIRALFSRKNIMNSRSKEDG